MLKNNNIKISGFLVFSSLLTIESAYSAGFAIPEASVEGVALSDSMVANPDLFGAFVYNYSSMAFHENDHISADFIGVALDTEVQSLAPNTEIGRVKNQAADAVIPSFYLAYRMTERYSFGFHLGVPFGLESVWPANTFSQFEQVDTAVGGGGEITGLHPLKSSLELYVLSPSIATRLGDQFAVAFGIDYYTVDKVEFNTVGSQTGGEGDELGWNISAQYAGNDWTAGLSYHSAVDVKLNGSTSINGLGVVNAKASLGLPYRFHVGVGHKLGNALYAEVDIERIGWSNYDTTVLEATGGALPAGTVYSVTSNNWDDVTNYRVGLVYELNESNQLLFGAGYEETGQRDAYFDATIADADRYMLSIGFIRKLHESWFIKAGYQYAWIDDRTVAGESYLQQIADSSGQQVDANGTDAYNGRYAGHIQMLSLGITRTF